MLRPLSLIKKLSVFLLVYVSANMASAQVYNSSVSVATGGTGRAAVEPGDSSFMNPASLAHLVGRYLFTSFAKDEFAATLSDNTKESSIPASANYVQKYSQVENLGDLKEHDFGITLSEFLTERLAFGVTGHYLEQILPNSNYNKINADLGVLYTPVPHIGLGLAVYNVFGENSDAPAAIRHKTTVGGGFNYVYRSMVRFRVDADSESVVGVGLETFLNRFIVTRFGFSDDFNDPNSRLTVGLGFSGPRFRLNYAYYGNTEKSSDYRHSVDLILPF